MREILTFTNKFQVWLFALIVICVVCVCIFNSTGWNLFFYHIEIFTKQLHKVKNKNYTQLLGILIKFPSGLYYQSDNFRGKTSSVTCDHSICQMVGNEENCQTVSDLLTALRKPKLMHFLFFDGLKCSCAVLTLMDK